MPIVAVRDGSSAARSEPVLNFTVPDSVSLRELVRTRVREEVAKANADRGNPHRLLVQPLEAEVDLNGYRLKGRKPIDWQRQADTAEQAFEQNGFFVIVDGRQIESLDEKLELSAESEIVFVKLTPLVGG